MVTKYSQLKKLFIVKDEKQYLELKRRQLEQRIKVFVDKGIKLVKGGNHIIGISSPIKLSKKRELALIELGEEILSLKKREEAIKSKIKTSPSLKEGEK